MGFNQRTGSSISRLKVSRLLDYDPCDRLPKFRMLCHGLLPRREDCLFVYLYPLHVALKDFLDLPTNIRGELRNNGIALLLRTDCGWSTMSPLIVKGS